MHIVAVQLVGWYGLPWLSSWWPL